MSVVSTPTLCFCCVYFTPNACPLFSNAPGDRISATTILLIILGAGFGPVPVAWSAFVIRKVPQLAEVGGGVVVAATQSAFALGALIGGVVFDLSGSTGVFVLSCASWLIAGLIVLWRITDFEPEPISTIGESGSATVKVMPRETNA